jgi:hypothetical protein
MPSDRLGRFRLRLISSRALFIAIEDCTEQPAYDQIPVKVCRYVRSTGPHSCFSRAVIVHDPKHQLDEMIQLWLELAPACRHA